MVSDNKKNLISRAMIFLSEVKKEVSQVIWPTRRETTITTIVVCLFAFVMSLYLVFIDQGLYRILKFIMN